MAYKKIGVRERLAGPRTRPWPKLSQEEKHVFGEKLTEAIRGTQSYDHDYQERFEAVKDKVSSLLSKKKIEQAQLRRLQMITGTGQFKSKLQMELDHDDFFRQLEADDRQKRLLVAEKELENARHASADEKRKLFGSAMGADFIDEKDLDYRLENVSAGSYRQSPAMTEIERLEKENKALKEKLEGLRSPVMGVINAITSLENKLKSEKEVRKIATYSVSTALGGFFVIASLLEWIFG